MQIQTIRRITSTHTVVSLHRHAPRHLSAHPSRPSLHLLYPHLALLLSLMLFAGLSGCGPASSDNTPNLGPRANSGGLPPSEQSQSPRKDPLIQTANPVPLASANNMTGATSGGETGKNSFPEPPIPSPKPADSGNTSVMPAWMAKELESPDIGTRLRALETWVKSAPPGSVDPLITAYYENKDERVLARAMELIEQDWARADAGN